MSRAMEGTVFSTASAIGLNEAERRDRMSAYLQQHTIREDTPAPDYIYNVGGVNVMPKKSLTVVSGAKKGGKSNWVGVLIAAALSEEHTQIDGSVRYLPRDRPQVVIMDTEQPLHDASRTYMRMMASAGLKGKKWTDYGVTAYSIRAVPDGEKPEQWRRLAVEIALQTHSPSLLVIDGLADMLPSVNAEQSAGELFSWIANIADSYNVNVIGCLHTKRGGGGVEGWSGNIAEKKYSDGFTVRKENDKRTFTVSHEGRGECAHDITFAISTEPGDEVGTWVSATAVRQQKQADKAKEKQDKDTELLDGAPLPCSITQLIDYLDAHDINKRTAKEWISKWRRAGILTDSKQGRTVILSKA